MKHQTEITQFFLDNPFASEAQVHAWAKSIGIPHEEIEGEVFHLLSDLLKTVGKHNDVPDSQFDPDELATGIKVEREHTNSDALAKMIAKDHLSELPDYYTRLEKMEKSAVKTFESATIARKAATRLMEVAITEKTFKGWTTKQQRDWIKDHPTSKFAKQEKKVEKPKTPVAQKAGKPVAVEKPTAKSIRNKVHPDYTAMVKALSKLARMPEDKIKMLAYETNYGDIKQRPDGYSIDFRSQAKLNALNVELDPSVWKKSRLELPGYAAYTDNEGNQVIMPPKGTRVTFRKVKT